MSEKTAQPSVKENARRRITELERAMSEKVAQPSAKRRMSILSELNWSGFDKREPPWSTHKRIYICIILCCIASFAIWNSLFPDMHWFLKVWAAGVTGAAIGTVIGYCWQLRDPKRRSDTSGWFLIMGVFGWGFFAAISICLLAPDFKSQEAELAKIRSLEHPDIVEVRVFGGGYRSRFSEDNAMIKRFQSLARNAALFYPSHEGSSEEFEISIQLKDGSILSYEARLPERHPRDFSIQFYGYSSWCEILFPDGVSWLETYHK